MKINGMLVRKMNKIKQGRQDPSTLINCVHIFESKQSTVLNLQQTSVYDIKTKDICKADWQRPYQLMARVCIEQCKANLCFNLSA